MFSNIIQLLFLQSMCCFYDQINKLESFKKYLISLLFQMFDHNTLYIWATELKWPGIKNKEIFQWLSWSL